MSVSESGAAVATASIEARIEARRVTLYFGDQCVSLVAYPGTPRDELLASVREVLGVPLAAPLRFRDADGAVVLLSGAVPDGATLHVKLEQGFPLSGEDAAASPDSPAERGGGGGGASGEWRTWASSHGGSVTEEGLMYENTDGPKGFWALTHAVPARGRHYVTVDVLSTSMANSEDAEGTRVCCVTIGLVPAAVVSMPSEHIHHDEAWPYMVPVGGIGLGPAGVMSPPSRTEPAMTIGVFIDMEKRRAVLVNHARPQDGAVRFDGLPAGGVKVAVQGPKHRITARLTRAELPAGGVHAGKGAQFSKTAGAAAAVSPARRAAAAVAARVAEERAALKAIVAAECDSACFKRIWGMMKDEEVTSVRLLARVDADELAAEYALKAGPRGVLRAAVRAAIRQDGGDDYVEGDDDAEEDGAEDSEGDDTEEEEEDADAEGSDDA
jgi:hypothetical protein